MRKKKKLLRVMIESPYAGDVHDNILYLHSCMMDSLNRGEAPFASHGFYTEVLNDDDQKERALGIKCGYAWMKAADRVVFYVDKGWSKGMRDAFITASTLGKDVEMRRISKIENQENLTSFDA